MAAEKGAILTGKAAIGDWTSDAPGVRRKITVADLPPPSSNILAINMPRVVRRSADTQPKVPTGFKVELYAGGFRDPRFMLTAPNGDTFVVESRANQIKVLRDSNADGKPDRTEIFAELFVCREYRWRHSISLPKWRSQSAWASRKISRAAFWWCGAAAKRRTLDTRYRLFTGR
ncbi:MAG: hypothetical protein DMF26_11560 [Verrucomicrobia bacterium]|nr:MAG: hypothetical protein DMF26_11560 [Verrucomicrobiota bacterium]